MPLIAIFTLTSSGKRETDEFDSVEEILEFFEKGSENGGITPICIFDSDLENMPWYNKDKYSFGGAYTQADEVWGTLIGSDYVYMGEDFAEYIKDDVTKAKYMRMIDLRTELDGVPLPKCYMQVIELDNLKNDIKGRQQRIFFLLGGSPDETPPTDL